MFVSLWYFMKSLILKEMLGVQWMKWLVGFAESRLFMDPFGLESCLNIGKEKLFLCFETFVDVKILYSLVD